MADNTKSFWQIIKQTFAEFVADDCASMAAGLAYYTIFSLPPLLVIVVSVAGLFWSPEDLQGIIDSQIESMVGEGGKQQIHSMMTQAGQHDRGIVATIIGIAVLLVGATGLVAQLQHALNKAWEVEPDPAQGGIKNFIIKRILSFAMILAVAFLLLVSLVVTTVLSMFGNALVSMLPDGVSSVWMMMINTLVSFVVIWLLFTSMFKFLPDAKIAWRDVWIGGAITSVLFMVGKVLIGLYLGSQASGAGPVILLLLWIYYSAMILLLGTEFTQVWARSYGKAIEPEAGAVRVERAKAYQRPGRVELAAPAQALAATAPERDRTLGTQDTSASSRPPVESRSTRRFPLVAVLVLGALLLKSRMLESQRR